jgi:clan AA aspartic protease
MVATEPIEREAKMGRVIVKLKLTNSHDLSPRARQAGGGEPRCVEVEALVDTGATTLCLKPSVIRHLGLEVTRQSPSQTAAGTRMTRIYSPVPIELMERSGNFDVFEVDESAPNLLGQLPLELFDLLVDSRAQRVTPNPAHGNQWVVEML